MPERNGKLKCKKIGLSNADVLAKYHKLSPDSIRLNNCKTYAEQQLEVCMNCNFAKGKFGRCPHELELRSNNKEVSSGHRSK